VQTQASLAADTANAPHGVLHRGKKAAACGMGGVEYALRVHVIAALCSKATTLILAHCGIFATISN